MSDREPTYEATTIVTMIRHIGFVQLGLERIVAQLKERAVKHDLSKFSPEEFPGFCRINNIARNNPYPSKEYSEGLDAERETINLHYSRNSHHPEFCMYSRSMMFLDILEMVVDWWAAWKTYGSKNKFKDNVEYQIKRFDFTEGQVWMILELRILLEQMEMASRKQESFDQ